MANTLSIDLRSDTVTRPTAAMRNAMANAEVGDDVLGDDPTVKTLQEKVAAILRKEAALFVPSGTMANQVCIAAQTRPGEELLLEEYAHILNHEAGAPALLSGVQIRTAKGNLGRLSAAQIKAKILKGSDHTAATTLVAVECTHNHGGGSVYERAELRAIRAVADEARVLIHLDGARLWNAAVATGCEEWEFAQFADSVSVCFSKGLGAPIGSAVAGTYDFIKRAHRFRKIFGGGMRQAGVVAAAALYALDHHRKDLIEDHRKAQLLAETLLQCNAFTMPEAPQTNIVYIDVVDPRVDAKKLELACGGAGVLMFAEGPSRFRLVTHRDVSLDSVRTAGDIILAQVQQIQY